MPARPKAKSGDCSTPALGQAPRPRASGLPCSASRLLIAYATTDIPEPNELANAAGVDHLLHDGKTEIDRIEAEGNRESVPLSKVPKAVQQAVLAAEDRDFYDELRHLPDRHRRAARG